jgi:hypothetical protein
MVHMSPMAYSEMNLDMILILGAEKMAGGRNDSADWSPPPAKTMLIGHQLLRLEGSQLLPGKRNHGFNLPLILSAMSISCLQYCAVAEKLADTYKKGGTYECIYRDSSRVFCLHVFCYL